MIIDPWLNKTCTWDQCESLRSWGYICCKDYYSGFAKPNYPVPAIVSAVEWDVFGGRHGKDDVACNCVVILSCEHKDGSRTILDVFGE